METGFREEGEETGFSLVHTFGGSCHFPSLPPFSFPVTKMISCRRHVCICRILSASVFLNMKYFALEKFLCCVQYLFFAVLRGALGFKKHCGEIDSLLWDISLEILCLCLSGEALFLLGYLHMNPQTGVRTFVWGAMTVAVCPTAAERTGEDQRVMLI